MSMFGSLKADYAAWLECADASIVAANTTSDSPLLREAFLAGAAAVVGGAGKVKSEERNIDSFLVEYREQINNELRALGFEVPE